MLVHYTLEESKNKSVKFVCYLDDEVFDLEEEFERLKDNILTLESLKITSVDSRQDKEELPSWTSNSGEKDNQEVPMEVERRQIEESFDLKIQKIQEDELKKQPALSEDQKEEEGSDNRSVDQELPLVKLRVVNHASKEERQC